MQDKDFDQYIRNAADNFLAPDYNPADWDKLEDRLHNLNAPQAEPTVTNPSAGAGFGKLAMVASAVVVTAVNAVLYFNGENRQSATQPAKEVAAIEVQAPAVNSAEPVTAITAIVPENNPASISPENANETAGTGFAEQELSTESEFTPSSVASTLAMAPVAKNNQTAAAKSSRKASGNQQASASDAGIRNQFGASGMLSGQTGSGFTGKPGGNAGGSASGFSNSAVAGDACRGNETPELAYAIIGTDTIYGSRIGLNACRQVQIRFVTTDKEADQVVVATNVPEILPGAAVSVTKNTQPEIILNWNPDASLARQKPYNFTVWLKDSRCPDAKPRIYNYTLSLTPAFTLALNGITSIEKGQTTSLEATGAPEGSGFKWTGPGMQTNFQEGKIFVAPLTSATYIVQVKSPAGCIYTDSVRVDVTNNKQPEVMAAKYIPNIFTPNGDGSNDYFEIRLPEAGTVSLAVFDRWNRKVYSNNNYRNNWEAENLPAGTYYYLITVSESNKNYKGWVEVIR